MPVFSLRGGRPLPLEIAGKRDGLRAAASSQKSEVSLPSRSLGERRRAKGKERGGKSRGQPPSPIGYGEPRRSESRRKRRNPQDASIHLLLESLTKTGASFLVGGNCIEKLA